MNKLLKEYKHPKIEGNCKDCIFSELSEYTGYLMPENSEISLFCHAPPKPWIHFFPNNGIENFNFGCGMFKKENK